MGRPVLRNGCLRVNEGSRISDRWIKGEMEKVTFVRRTRRRGEEK